VNSRFVPLTDVLADKMVQNARTAAMTGRTAALGRHGQWQQLGRDLPSVLEK
jgi:hypothetical protein